MGAKVGVRARVHMRMEMQVRVRVKVSVKLKIMVNYGVDCKAESARVKPPAESLWTSGQP